MSKVSNRNESSKSQIRSSNQKEMKREPSRDVKREVLRDFKREPSREVKREPSREVKREPSKNKKLVEKNSQPSKVKQFFVLEKKREPFFKKQGQEKQNKDIEKPLENLNESLSDQSFRIEEVKVSRSEQITKNQGFGSDLMIGVNKNGTNSFKEEDNQITKSNNENKQKSNGEELYFNKQSKSNQPKREEDASKEIIRSNEIEIETLKSKVNNLEYFEKKIHCVGFIFNDEAKEFAEIVKKLDPSFKSECDFSNDNPDILDNKISQYFSELKSFVLKLSANKEIQNKSVINQTPIKSTNQQGNLNNQSDLQSNQNKINSSLNPSQNINNHTSNLSQTNINSNQQMANVNQSNLNLNQQLSNDNQSNILLKQPMSNVVQSNLNLNQTNSFHENIDYQNELNYLRKKLNHYDILQDELNYYKNLSLSYHKKNSNYLIGSIDNYNYHPRVYDNINDRYDMGNRARRIELLNSYRLTNYSSGKHNVCTLENYNRNY